ncbi:MAG: LysM peptidoglycan-binding domain-containing protein [Microcoleus sp. SM1_3_4]|nr:LysM peptidoglycan-binding domain-containing protein [Microcoleus sp. SM1_3_4]
MGASGILLPRSGDSARATEPAPAAEPAAEVQPASTTNVSASSERVDATAELGVTATANSTAAEPLLPVSQQPSWPAAEGIPSEQPASTVGVPTPAAAIDPEQELNLTGSQPLSPAPIWESAPSATAPGTEALDPDSTLLPDGNGAIDSLKKQENRTTTVRPAELGFEEPASSYKNKSSVPVEISGQNPAPAATATKTTIPDLSTTPVIPSAQIDAQNAGVRPEATVAQPFESIEQSIATPSLPSAAVVSPVENATAPAPMLYSVRPGDTVSAIAKGHGVSAQELIAINKLGDPNFLNVNQRLKIPQTIGSNNSAVRAAASTSASYSTSVPSATGTPGVLLPSSPAPEVANSGTTSPAPTVPLVSPLANIEGLNNISAPMVPKINSIPLTQVSQSMSDAGKLELQGEPTYRCS